MLKMTGFGETNRFCLRIGQNNRVVHKIGTQWDLKMSIAQNFPTTCKQWSAPPPYRNQTDRKSGGWGKGGDVGGCGSMKIEDKITEVY